MSPEPRITHWSLLRLEVVPSNANNQSAGTVGRNVNVWPQHKLGRCLPNYLLSHEDLTSDDINCISAQETLMWSDLVVGKNAPVQATGGIRTCRMHNEVNGPQPRVGPNGGYSNTRLATRRTVFPKDTYSIVLSLRAPPASRD